MIQIDDLVVLWVDDEMDHTKQILGEYSDTPGPGCIDRSLRPGFEASQLRYWNPMFLDQPTEDIEADFRRCEAYCAGKWHYEGCIVRAVVSYAVDAEGHRRVEHLSSAGIFGIESDSPEVYRLELVAIQLGELKEHLAHFGVEWNDVAIKFVQEQFRKLSQLREAQPEMAPGSE